MEKKLPDVSEWTLKDQMALYKANLETVEEAILKAGPRKNLAADLEVSESYLSKALNGMLIFFCKLLAHRNLKIVRANLECVEAEYLKGLKIVAKEEIRP